MDILDKAGKVVGDAVAKARERERIRLTDRIALLDRIAGDAATSTHERKLQPGYTWDQAAEKAHLDMLAAAAAVDDEALTTAVDGLIGIDVPMRAGVKPPVAQLDAAYRAVVTRLGQLRRETLAPD